MLENLPPPAPKKRKPKGRPVHPLEIAQKKAKLARKRADRASKDAFAAKSRLQQLEKAAEGKQGLVTLPAAKTAETLLLDPIFEGRRIAFSPNPGPQTEFLAATEREVFYGGARGGGKSYSLLVDPLRYCHQQAARGLILRRTMPELRDLINHSHRLYRDAFPEAKWREQEKEWRFPSGARIEFGYAETRQDALRYQGQSYTWIGVDELPQYPTADIWNDLRGSLRSVDPNIPEYMRATGNPGNVGSAWVKETFITPAEWNTRFFISIELPDGTVSRISRRFIPAKLTDNPYLTRTKSYMTMLASLPSTQRKQWLEGNWNVWDGAAFPEFDREIHTCSPFEIPKSWIKYRACDWGFSQPAVCLWMAIDYDNNIWVYREYKTTHTTADVFARKIRELESNDRVQFGVLDSSVWSMRGDVGPSIVEVMRNEGVAWRRSDRSPRSRANGKMEIHRRLAIDEFTKQPKLKIFSTCHNLINELPSLPLDENNPEDVDTKANDHSYDALRYGCMARPIGPGKADELARMSESLKYQPADTIFGY